MLRADVAEVGNGVKGRGLRHRQMAKAAGKQPLPGPTATAPALDPTTCPLLMVDEEMIDKEESLRHSSPILSVNVDSS